MADKTAALCCFEGATLELGCGNRKTIAGSIGIDLVDSPQVDIVGDVYEVLDQIPSGVIDRIVSAHFFEHVADLPRLMSATARVLRVGGEMTVTVPHFSNPYFYSDPTHRTLFGLYSFCYLARCDLFARRLPTYVLDPAFELVDVRLRFHAEVGNAVSWRMKGVLNRMVNRSRRNQEAYEAAFTRWASCYDVSYTLLRSGA